VQHISEAVQALPGMKNIADKININADRILATIRIKLFLVYLIEYLNKEL